MTTTIMSSRDFNHDVGKAKRATAKGPVIITDRGEPSHVLLSIKEYQKLTGEASSIVDLLADKRAATIEFEIQRFSGSSLKATEITSECTF